MSDKNERIALLVNTVFEEWHGKILTLVAAAQKNRQVRADVSADVLSHHIIMTIEGGIMLARLKKSERHLRDCLRSLRTLLELKV